MTKLGLDVLLESELGLIGNKSVGLITNLTGVNGNLDYNISLLIKHGIKLDAIFSPEHGLWGSAQDAVSIPSSKYDKIPIYSLYGNAIKPTPEMLKGLEVVIFDIQDVGVRFYTYISTMALAMEACAENKIDFIVLDRPNPINGATLEGNVLDPLFSSFVGKFPILLRHGMTIGELAKLFNKYFNINSNLHVVKMKGWKRDTWFDETGLNWVMPSPNMPTLDTAIVYPGTCLFEGTNLSEGRGTTRPFEIIGAPYIDARMLADMLNEKELHGVKFRPTYFTPIFPKHKDSNCGGVQVHVIDRNKFKPVRTALYMIDSIKKAYPDDFQWIGKNKFHFDLLMGTDKVRLSISDGQPVDDIISSWQDEQTKFSNTRSKYLLYF